MRGRRVGSRLKVPAALEKFPSELEGDERLSCARGEGEQDTLLVGGYLPPTHVQWQCPGNIVLPKCRPCPRMAMAAKRSRQPFWTANVRSQSSAGLG